jgi:hypothetical protein
MNSFTCANDNNPKKEDNGQEIYEAPAIILESRVTVRAGTEPTPAAADPTDLFNPSN